MLRKGEHVLLGQEQGEDGGLSAAVGAVQVMGPPEGLQGKALREWAGSVVSTWGSSSTFEGVLQQSRQRTGQWQEGGEGQKVLLGGGRSLCADGPGPGGRG